LEMLENETFVKQPGIFMIDLVPRENVELWLKYLRNEYPAIAFKASTQTQRRNLSQSNMSADIASQDMLNSSECLGADQLIKLLKNYCRNLNMKTSITVGVIGYPNVGKSSVINSLKRSKVCGVGSTPGFTKVAQQITLDKNIKLLDCPGIVFAAQGHNGESDAEVLLRNCVKVELLDDPITPGKGKKHVFIVHRYRDLTFYLQFKLSSQDAIWSSLWPYMRSHHLTMFTNFLCN
jgi:nuclear GTP-binding protein